jgi:hypothetical protein
MSLSESYLSTEDLHPIDIVETLAESHDWDFDRVTDDQIAMAVEGQWRTYSADARLVGLMTRRCSLISHVRDSTRQRKSLPDSTRFVNKRQRSGLDWRLHLLDGAAADGLALWSCADGQSYRRARTDRPDDLASGDWRPNASIRHSSLSPGATTVPRSALDVAH